MYSYHTGLDVDMCDGEITRLFTNNVVWNDTEHGKLYKWVGSKKKDVNMAMFAPFSDRMYIKHPDLLSAKGSFA